MLRRHLMTDEEFSDEDFFWFEMCRERKGEEKLLSVHG